MKCHCGEDGIAKCPCCNRMICGEHLALAATALAKGAGVYGIAKPEEDE